jgi:peptide/nickel transport system substrate-binding protein
MKKKSLWGIGLALIALLAAACQPQATEVEVTRVVQETVEVEVEVTRVITETIIEEGEEVEVTRIVEQTIVATPDRASDPRFGGTLRQASVGLVQFDQIFGNDGPSFAAMSLINTYLYRMENYGDPYPDLAESWEWTDDTTLAFYLRPGVMFHDGNEVFPEGEGREVVADDVVYSMERWLNTDGSAITGDVSDVFVSIEAVDDYTVQFNLSAPSLGLFDQVNGLANLAIVPHEAVEFYGEDFAFNPIGAGPFEFVEYIPDDHLTVRNNEDYWIECFLDSVEIQVIPDPGVSLIALESGDVDVVSSVPGAELDRMLADNDYIAYYRNSATPAMIQFPGGVADFQEKNFRQAIAYTIDYRGIGRAVYGGVIVPGCGNLSPGIRGHVSDLCEEYFPYDPAGAVELLAEIGWTDSDGDGVLDRDGEPMEPILINTFNLASMDRVLEIVVTQLREIGIPAESELVEFGTWAEMYASGAPDSQTNERRLRMWLGCGGPNSVQLCWGRDATIPTIMGYNNEEVFDLIDQANVATDPDEQEALLQQAEALLFGEYWVINATEHRSAIQFSAEYVKDHPVVWHNNNVCTLDNNVWLDN